MTIENTISIATDQLKLAGISSARLDASLLLAFVLGKPQAWLVAHCHDEVLENNFLTYQKLVQKRISRIPLVHLTNYREFYGLNFYVNSDVLTPRVETETMVGWAIEALPQSSQVLDVGTGCGAIAIALKHYRPDLVITAADISEPALQVARRNADSHCSNVRFLESNLFGSISPDDPLFDAVLANLPYLAKNVELMPEVLNEPAVALFGGDDGLDLYRDFFREIPKFLNNQAYVYTECDRWQQQALEKLATKAGLSLGKQDYFISELTR